EQVVRHRQAAHEHGGVLALLAREGRRHLVAPLLDVIDGQAELLALLRLELRQLRLDRLERELVQTTAIPGIDRAHRCSSLSCSQRMTARAGDRLAVVDLSGATASSRPALARSSSIWRSSEASTRPMAARRSRMWVISSTFLAAT